jgi:hypothetical protein
VLHEHVRNGKKPLDVLHYWLFNILYHPLTESSSPVYRVIHTEISFTTEDDGTLTFLGNSRSGWRLLNSLVDYCRSYDDWQFRRWLHHLQASDFSATL